MAKSFLVSATSFGFYVPVDSSRRLLKLGFMSSRPLDIMADHVLRQGADKAQGPEPVMQSHHEGKRAGLEPAGEKATNGSLDAPKVDDWGGATKHGRDPGVGHPPSVPRLEVDEEMVKHKHPIDRDGHATEMGWGVDHCMPKVPPESTRSHVVNAASKPEKSQLRVVGSVWSMHLVVLPADTVQHIVERTAAHGMACEACTDPPQDSNQKKT